MDKIEQAVEGYLAKLYRLRSTGEATAETSFYSPLEELLNAIGEQLKPKVFCLSQLADQGAGHPDFGLFTAPQCQRGHPRPGTLPERGVIEVKPVASDAWFTAETRQISKYWERYRFVLVTNLRSFLMIGEDRNGNVAQLESYQLAATEQAFWDVARTARSSATALGKSFGEYLRRALTQSVPLREPKDVAWFLASHARDALARVEAKGSLRAMKAIRDSLEQALGVRFEGDKGEHFFRSTLIQTLFYGVFSAWVLWARTKPLPTGRFDWRTAVWHLNVPMIRALFAQLSEPGRLRPLDLVDVLDWTEGALNRVEQAAFFARFQEAEAVEYFYEPFLEAFDPELRKQLGVWYTPPDVVTYMVERVDRSLRDDLGIEDGLAAENVYVLDPCCGTGSFLAAVLRRIGTTLEQRGHGALVGQLVKKAAVERVFGFELLPAPLVVAHLQVGLRLQALDVPLSDEAGERAAIYLTNALTGWEVEGDRPPLPFPELAEERERAEGVKREKPILVILGNPPYNGYAGVNYSAEELALTQPYRRVRKVRPPEGQGLNDLYVRFFRMAERRIVERTGRGVICFISNYSWLDGLSFTGMRERFLQVFDVIRIDCLNGDKYKTGKVTPDGKPDPSIFSTEHNREGIQVGTAIALLVRKQAHKPPGIIGFRHLWGIAKRRELLDTAANQPETLYAQHTPPLGLGLPFLPEETAERYLEWPKLPELFPTSFPGVTTARDAFLIDICRNELTRRVTAYLDKSISLTDLQLMYPQIMNRTQRYDPEYIRQTLLSSSNIYGSIVRYNYRPLDVRWIFWEGNTKLLDEKRSSYNAHIWPTNIWICTRQGSRTEDFYQPQVFSRLADFNVGESKTIMIPLYLRDEQAPPDENGIRKRPNLTRSVAERLAALGLAPEDLFHHVVAVLHAPAYRIENAGALRMDWPRVPFPVPAEALRRSADLGCKLAALLDPEVPVPGVTAGALRPELALLAQPCRVGGGALRDDDLKLAAGWGYRGQGGAVMPGQGLVRPREYTETELGSLATGANGLGMSTSDMLALLGATTNDVHLNVDASWANVSANVWSYTLGGYQVIKKWLSYREQRVLGRSLKPDEVAYVSAMVRRVAAILLLGPALDASYTALKASADVEAL